MTDDRPPKKSESIEVRLPYEAKRDFLAACKATGRTVSEVVRELIDAYVADWKTQEEALTPKKKGVLLRMIPPPGRKRYVAAGAIAALGLAAAVALPSAASPDFQAVFNRLDANHDGRLSLDEFQVATAPHSIVYFNGQARDAKDAPINPKPETLVIPMAASASSIADWATFRDDKGFAAFDTDGDGKISKAEYDARELAMLRATFRLFDANGDGRVTENETRQPIRITSEALTVIGKPEAGQSFPQFKIMDFDANHDGVVTLDEFLPK